MKDKYLVKHYSRGICECVFGWGHFWVGGLGKAKWSSFMCREEVKGGGPEWSILGYRSSQPSALLGSQLHLNHSSFGSLVPELRIELHQLWLFCFLKCLKLYNQTIQLFKTHIHMYTHSLISILLVVILQNVLIQPHSLLGNGILLQCPSFPRGCLLTTELDQWRVPTLWLKYPKRNYSGERSLILAYSPKLYSPLSLPYNEWWMHADKRPLWGPGRRGRAIGVNSQRTLSRTAS